MFFLGMRLAQTKLHFKRENFMLKFKNASKVKTHRCERALNYTQYARYMLKSYQFDISRTLFVIYCSSTFSHLFELLAGSSAICSLKVNGTCTRYSFLGICYYIHHQPSKYTCHYYNCQFT